MLGLHRSSSSSIALRLDPRGLALSGPRAPRIGPRNLLAVAVSRGTVSTLTESRRRMRASHCKDFAACGLCDFLGWARRTQPGGCSEAVQEAKRPFHEG